MMMMNVGMKRSFHFGDLAHFSKEDYSAVADGSRKRLRAVSDDSPDIESTKIEDFFPTARKREQEQGNLPSPPRPATLISPNSSTAAVVSSGLLTTPLHPSQSGESAAVPPFPMFTAGDDRRQRSGSTGSCGACSLVSLPTPALKRRFINNKNAASTDDYSHSYEDQDSDDFVVPFWATRPDSQPRKENYSNSFERRPVKASSNDSIISRRVSISLVPSRKSSCVSVTDLAGASPATPTTTPRQQRSIYYAPVQDTPSVAQIAATLERHLRVSSESLA